MPDTLFGLQRRYTMDEILEKAGGKTRIKPLNYDALTQLRNPLYVKMGQTLAAASTDQNAKIIAELDAANRLCQGSGRRISQVFHFLTGFERF